MAPPPPKSSGLATIDALVSDFSDSLKSPAFCKVRNKACACAKSRSKFVILRSMYRAMSSASAFFPRTGERLFAGNFFWRGSLSAHTEPKRDDGFTFPRLGIHGISLGSHGGGVERRKPGTKRRYCAKNTILETNGQPLGVFAPTKGGRIIHRFVTVDGTFVEKEKCEFESRVKLCKSTLKSAHLVSVNTLNTGVARCVFRRCGAITDTSVLLGL